MPRTLITGGAGFVGSHLCERFLAEGHEVICMDNLITGSVANVEHLLESDRFLFVTSGEVEVPDQEIQGIGPVLVVVNWFEELRQRMGGD